MNIGGTITATPEPALPGVLQACFAPELGSFAWWGVPDPVAAAGALGLPGGTADTLRIALPTGTRVTATDVPAALLDPDTALAALAGNRPAASASLRAWADLACALSTTDTVLDALADRLPTAGHAAVSADGTIFSARATVHALRPAPIRATLRPYQRAGVAWLSAAGEHGGGVLADEMGLGKTVQAIALLAGRGDGVHLVVCPTSVLGNWARELARFAPAVPVLRYRGGVELSGLAAGTVVLTGYQTLRANAAELSTVDWDVAVLDEAQQIKNPDAQVSRAARGLTARLRLAMTGTPVENRLDELWSLLAFTNPDLLGNRARFRRRFAAAADRGAAATRLHELVGPHLLRRRKADVAPELPPKIEVDVRCALTGEQERLYRAALDEAFGAGFGGGMQRHGRVLALLTRLKQICNHPELLCPNGSLAGRSGKLDRLTEILAEVVDNGEAALVFTQYRRTGELLAEHLRAEVTGARVPFLHGGLALSTRDALVAEFGEPDGPPVFLLSLRAAGFGLNLTRATHVLHYDQWWNPAVQDQASDRAHRIGQTRTVTVHSLCTERTLEETIAELHAGKRGLAELPFGGVAAERDLARLSDDELRAALDPQEFSPGAKRHR